MFQPASDIVHIINVAGISGNDNILGTDGQPGDIHLNFFGNLFADAVEDINTLFPARPNLAVLDDDISRTAIDFDAASIGIGDAQTADNNIALAINDDWVGWCKGGKRLGSASASTRETDRFIGTCKISINN